MIESSAQSGSWRTLVRAARRAVRRLAVPPRRLAADLTMAGRVAALAAVGPDQLPLLGVSPFAALPPEAGPEPRAQGRAVPARQGGAGDEEAGRRESSPARHESRASAHPPGRGEAGPPPQSPTEPSTPVFAMRRASLGAPARGRPAASVGAPSARPGSADLADRPATVTGDGPAGRIPESSGVGRARSGSLLAELSEAAFRHRAPATLPDSTGRPSPAPTPPESLPVGAPIGRPVPAAAPLAASGSPSDKQPEGPFPTPGRQRPLALLARLAAAPLAAAAADGDRPDRPPHEPRLTASGAEDATRNARPAAVAIGEPAAVVSRNGLRPDATASEADPEPGWPTPLTPETLADMVNEALVEQARRHGVDVS